MNHKAIEHRTCLFYFDFLFISVTIKNYTFIIICVLAMQIGNVAVDYIIGNISLNITSKKNYKVCTHDFFSNIKSRFTGPYHSLSYGPVLCCRKSLRYKLQYINRVSLKNSKDKTWQFNGLITKINQSLNYIFSRNFWFDSSWIRRIIFLDLEYSDYLFNHICWNSICYQIKSFVLQ